jgi:hypothetical protein
VNFHRIPFRLSPDGRRRRGDRYDLLRPGEAWRSNWIKQHSTTQKNSSTKEIDDEQREKTKRRYKFPYGDFKKVHRCALLSAERRAGRYKHFDIEAAVAHLHGMIDA